MPKRRAASVDSESESEQPQPSKRARTRPNNVQQPAEGSRGRSRRAVEEEPEEENAPAAGADGNDNDEPIEIDDEEDIQEDAPLDAAEEQKFEELNEETIRDKLMNAQKIQGNIAEMGIIEKLELHQFMCHKYLEFTFGPQINFIIGHNGSGKSAVLSALTVALGGKATVTGRGSGLKSFIREGQNASEVTVVLKNQGEDAYKRDIYGDSIIITRRFTKEGSSSYKIKSKEGKVISTKREELSAICDHMNIQVDNPMNILTQDSARQFLSASQPADKYRFFLRGTQLSQLSEEYSTCLENISQTTKILKSKSEVLPDLEEALEEATARFKEAQKARDMKYKVDELKKELAWSHVATKEQELREKVKEAEKCKAKLPKVVEKLKEAEENFNALGDEVVAREALVDELGNIEHLQDRQKALQEKLNENKRKLSRLNEEKKEMNSTKINCDSTIARYEKQIEEERRKIEEFSHDKREATQRKLDEATEQYKETEGRLHTLRRERAAADEEIIRVRNGHDDMKKQIDQAKRQIEDINAQLNLIAQRERNKLAPFGRNMEQVLEDFKRQQWYGQPPVGPLGQYVRVKDPKWAPFLRVRIGGLMSAFAITDARDRKTLEAILKRHGNSPQIIIAEVDLFDYSRGEPPARYMTALRALEVSDEYVLRVLINSSNVESILLAETRRAADEYLQELGTGLAWTADAYTVERFHGGGRSSLARNLGPQDPRHQLFTSSDVSESRRQWEEQLKQAEANYLELQKQFHDYANQGRALDRKLRDLKNQDEQLARQLRQLKSIRDALQDEANEALPVSVQALQTQLDEAKAERENVMNQFGELVRRIEHVNAEQHPVMEEYNKIKAQIKEHNERHQAALKAVQDAVELRLDAQKNVKYYTGKIEEEQAKIDVANEAVEQVELEFAQWTEKAEQYCARIENPRPTDEIQRQLESVSRALKEREKKQGASVEQMTLEVNKKKAALENARRELRTMLLLNKSLRKSIRTRLARWHEFRRHIALRCKIYFSYHLSNRGYFGKVLFDHVAGTLQLKVQTDDQAGTQGGNREKDPRSLSGGEKSFSTICLLLSLWESIGCPIRCLDEFDVFMDAVNRRISMRMMIDTANASDRKQYILITPQDMTNITIGKTVRVHRMSDPERGQGLLSF